MTNQEPAFLAAEHRYFDAADLLSIKTDLTYIQNRAVVLPYFRDI